MLSRLVNGKLWVSRNIICWPKLIANFNSDGKNEMTNDLLNYNPISDEHDHNKVNRKGSCFLTKVEIQSRYLSRYPELSSIKYHSLSRNIGMMEDLGLQEKAVVLMLMQNQPLILKCYQACKMDEKRYNYNRIQYICKTLKISPMQLLSTLPKYKFIFTVSFARIIKIITILLEHKVEPSAIFSDLWIVRGKPEHIESRLKKVQELYGLENLRPWMGRCRNIIFESFMSRESRKQKLLGENSLEEYLSQRLGHSPNEIQEIIDREPQLQRASVLKIKKILDFLFSSGFTAEHILSGLPRVANRRIETINARLQEMNQEGLPPSLYVLCKSEREYHHYINRRKKRRNIEDRR